MSQVRDKMSDAIATALADQQELVTGWVAVVEVIDADGERCLRTLAGPDLKLWDGLGMAAYLTETLRKRVRS